MASESSFDVVSRVDHQEVGSALDQAAKEIRNHLDFKGAGKERDDLQAVQRLIVAQDHDFAAQFADHR